MNQLADKQSFARISPAFFTILFVIILAVAFVEPIPPLSPRVKT